MLFSDLIKTHEEFINKEPDFDLAYSDSIKRKDVWNNTGDLDENKVKNVVMKFLIDYKCRGVSYKCASDLCEALKEYDIQINRFKGFDLLDYDFKRSEIEQIREIFDGISSSMAVNRKHYTATSKLLHMINRKFFVMWDNKIRENYGCFHNGRGYVNFLWDIKREMKKIISSYSEKNNISNGKARSEIEDKCSKLKAPRTFVKLIDEYNWMHKDD